MCHYLWPVAVFVLFVAHRKEDLLARFHSLAHHPSTLLCYPKLPPFTFSVFQAGNEVVKAPGNIVISAYCTCPDITLTVTPDLKVAYGMSS